MRMRPSNNCGIGIIFGEMLFDLSGDYSIVFDLDMKLLRAADLAVFCCPNSIPIFIEGVLIRSYLHKMEATAASGCQIGHLLAEFQV